MARLGLKGLTKFEGALHSTWYGATHYSGK